MNRTEILKGIYEHHGEAGLFFSPDYKRLSPSYGIDNEEDAKLVWNAAFNKMAKA